MGLICAPIQAKSLDDLRKKVKKASSYADLIEIWIDHLPSKIDPKEIINSSQKPLLIVNKTKKEKGLWEGSEKKRIERLKQFISPKTSFIDINIDTNRNLLKDLIKSKKKTKLILSYHNFKKTPSGNVLWQKVQKGFKNGADIVKIATFANNPGDNLTLLNLLNKANKYKKPIIILCMGKHGKISRIFGYILGSKISYIATDKNSKSAPGQLTHKEFDSLLKKI